MPTLVDPSIVEALLTHRMQPGGSPPLDYLRALEFDSKVANQPMPQLYRDQNAWNEMNTFGKDANVGVKQGI